MKIVPDALNAARAAVDKGITPGCFASVHSRLGFTAPAK